MTPAARAFFAMASPTFLAASMFFAPFAPLACEVANARVLPAWSSMTCAVMYFRLRCTDRRGRPKARSARRERVRSLRYS